MVTKICATVQIDFDCHCTDEQYANFKKKLKNELIDNFNSAIEDATSDDGFEADSIHPSIIEDIWCEKEE